MIYTTFEQIEYGFVLLEINKKHLDINRFRKIKIFLIWHLRTVTVLKHFYNTTIEIIIIVIEKIGKECLQNELINKYIN